MISKIKLMLEKIEKEIFYFKWLFLLTVFMFFLLGGFFTLKNPFYMKSKGHDLIVPVHMHNARASFSYIVDQYGQQIKDFRLRNKRQDCSPAYPECDDPKYKYRVNTFDYYQLRNHMVYNVKKDRLRYLKDLKNAPARIINSFVNGFERQGQSLPLPYDYNKGVFDIVIDDKNPPLTLPFYLSYTVDELKYFEPNLNRLTTRTSK